MEPRPANNKSKINIYLPPPKFDRPYNIAEMYEEYAELLTKLFSTMLRDNNHWAEDLTHETFVRLIEFSNSTDREIDPPMLGALLSHIAK